jgi:hypothetical protein
MNTKKTSIVFYLSSFVWESAAEATGNLSFVLNAQFRTVLIFRNLSPQETDNPVLVTRELLFRIFYLINIYTNKVWKYKHDDRRLFHAGQLFTNRWTCPNSLRAGSKAKMDLPAGTCWQKSNTRIHTALGIRQNRFQFGALTRFLFFPKTEDFWIKYSARIFRLNSHRQFRPLHFIDWPSADYTDR